LLMHPAATNLGYFYRCNGLSTRPGDGSHWSDLWPATLQACRMRCLHLWIDIETDAEGCVKPWRVFMTKPHGKCHGNTPPTPVDCDGFSIGGTTRPFLSGQAQNHRFAHTASIRIAPSTHLYAVTGQLVCGNRSWLCGPLRRHVTSRSGNLHSTSYRTLNYRPPSGWWRHHDGRSAGQRSTELANKLGSCFDMLDCGICGNNDVTSCTNPILNCLPLKPCCTSRLTTAGPRVYSISFKTATINQSRHISTAMRTTRQQRHCDSINRTAG